MTVEISKDKSISLQIMELFDHKQSVMFALRSREDQQFKYFYLVVGHIKVQEFIWIKLFSWGNGGRTTLFEMRADSFDSMWQQNVFCFL